MATHKGRANNGDWHGQTHRAECGRERSDYLADRGDGRAITVPNGGDGDDGPPANEMGRDQLVGTTMDEMEMRWDGRNGLTRKS
jgi:hypothetical protein